MTEIERLAGANDRFLLVESHILYWMHCEHDTDADEDRFIIRAIRRDQLERAMRSPLPWISLRDCANTHHYFSSADVGYDYARQLYYECEPYVVGVNEQTLYTLNYAMHDSALWHERS